MSWRQLNYWLQACFSVSAMRIDEMTFAFGRIQTNKEGSQKMEAQLERTRSKLLVALIKEDM